MVIAILEKITTVKVGSIVIANGVELVVTAPAIQIHCIIILVPKALLVELVRQNVPLAPLELPLMYKKQNGLVQIANEVIINQTLVSKLVFLVSQVSIKMDSNLRLASLVRKALSVLELLVRFHRTAQ
jgi:hypothetical protein